jgi:3-phosphoshikimate 1-carboxyvinyltransferase
MDVTVQPVTTSISGSITVPGDKSVSHRALLLGAIAEGTTTIHNFLASADCLCTAHCLTALGVSCSGLEGSAPATVQGRGLYGLKEPQDILYAGNSGTTARLLLGLLAGLPFTATLSGDASLRRRPMGRVTKPLAAMGAQFLGRRKNTMLPLTVRGGNLQGGVFRLPVASAQLKSALLLAGLYAQGETSIEEPAPSRDHTERMLRHFGVSLHQHGTRTTIPVKGGRRLTAQTVLVPGDISAAAFFLVAAAIIPGSCLTVQGVGLNPSRSGILDVLTAMGVQLEITNRYEESGEPRADISIESRPLKGTLIAGSLIPRLIDELPVLAVAACYAQGETVIKNAW